MTIDDKFRAYLVVGGYTESNYFSYCLLTKISIGKLSDDILILIEQFLESLSLEEAQEYVSQRDTLTGYSILFSGTH